MESLVLETVALSLYVAFVGFCFCDGFGLHMARKLVWFVFFTAVSLYVFFALGRFYLPLILPFPTLMAAALGAFQKRDNLNKESKKA